MRYSRFAWGALAALGAIYLSCRTGAAPSGTTPRAGPAIEATAAKSSGPDDAAATQIARHVEAPLPEHVHKALDWLAGAQQEDGGWGAGSSARQDVRDAHAVPTDPATTAVAAIALLRAGNGLERGDYAQSLQRATDYMLRAVETAKVEGPQITELTGTQPQAKMGQNVDTALCAQYLARLLQELPNESALRPRVAKALDKCVRKIESSQSADGSQAAGGWAPVLQSAQGSTALELAQLAGRPIDGQKLAQARAYQRRQVDAAGTSPAAAGGPAVAGVSVSGVRRDAAAGVALYASAANMRGVVADAKVAEQMVETAKREGRLDKGAKVDAGTLEQIGVEPPQAAMLEQSYTMNVAAKVRAFDEDVLQGFGNNGGEEFLSYQMKAESLVIDGGDEWASWIGKISERLAKVQNQDGSWSGHHCITSPSFCTATAISCLCAEADVEWLRKAVQVAAK
ncbi:MAG TPA: prenyltransferase/squalene oxidase repeat-containing protein [Planctomycetota bacterium]|nr:prenyltransferase/squalene oxidase repeat-containing protein [Planctomycetota bacterium]